LARAFAYVGLDCRSHLKISERYMRPLEVDSLIANTAKARERLSWAPRVGFRELVAIMVDADLEAAGLKAPGRGEAILEEKLGHWNRWQDSVSKLMYAVQGSASQH
jgi:GDPmannose 4,6-dehydratase